MYDPNRGRLHPRELYALIHVIFSDTNIQVYLHKKNYLSKRVSDVQEGVRLDYVVCDMCVMLCFGYVIKILGKNWLVTTNN